MHWTLLRWLIRQASPITTIALLTAVLYALFSNEPITLRAVWPFAFVVTHSVAIAVLLGRSGSASFVYLYARGYDRATLWRYTMLASAALVLVVWLPTAVIIWTPLRSMVQDHLFVSPYYPLVRPTESFVPIAWLLAYVPVLSAAHYAWIRRSQPTRGADAGDLLAAAVIVMLLLFVDDLPLLRSQPWVIWLTVGASGLITLTLIETGRRLHRHMEVIVK